MENSFHSRGSKNFVLKSDYINSSRHGSKKNLSSFVEQNLNNQNQKSLFKAGSSFFEQDDEEYKKDKINLQTSDKDLNQNIFNKPYFYEGNENNFWNKNKNSHNHSNIIQDYFCQNLDDNMEFFNNQFNNMNLSNNEINENNTDKNNNNNNHYFNMNYFNNINSSHNSIHSSNNTNSNASPSINFPTYQNNNNSNNNTNMAETNTNSITNETNNNNENNNMNQNNYISINPVLINHNNFNRQLILNSFNNNNSNNQNIYFPQMQNAQPYNNQINNLNSIKNGDIPISLIKKREENLINNCVTLCREQIECRLLQKKIDAEPSLASNVIYDKIKDKIQELSCDQFGNYFIQKVIENLNYDQISELLYKKISPNFRSFCFNQHGTRVIQKIFEKIINNEELLNYYNSLLTPNLKDFVVDQNASHIIIKYVNMLQAPKNDFIIKFLLDNSFDLATKKHSCCVLQKCIEYSNEEQKLEFLKMISAKSYGLFNDQYGNYVVQYCINLCNFEINKVFVQNFFNDIMKFSTQKYSSNIIEKCMDCCDEETKELITQKYCNPQIVEKLLFDMYGNYVLQKVMNLSKEPLTNKYISYIGPLMKNLSSYSFGPKLYNKLISSFPCLSNYVTNKNDQGKMKKIKNKKKAPINNINNELNEMNKNNNNDKYSNNMYGHKGGNNMNMMNMIEPNNNRNNNKFQTMPMFNPGMPNNFYMPFQFKNEMGNNTNNNMMFQGMMNNPNYGMNYGNGNNNSMNNTGSKLMYDYNNKQ